MLKSNDPNNQDDLVQVFVRWYLNGGFSFTHEEDDPCQANSHYEHGQWWITHGPTGAAWSVVDAEGGDAVDGYSFEQVSEGDAD